MQFEDEEKKQKEELLGKFLKLKVSKEVQKTRLNELKISQQWRQMLREAKLEELKRDLDTMRQTFQHILDHKDALIDSLASELEEAEIQQVHAICAHLHTLDELVEIEKQRSERLRQEHLRRLSELQEEFNKEYNKIRKTYDTEMCEIDDIGFTVHQQFLDSQREEKVHFQMKMDNLEQKGLVEKQSLYMKQESRVESVWCQLQNALQNYLENTEERTKLYLEMKAKDEHTLQDIEIHKEKIQTLNDTISHLREKIASSSTDNKDRNYRLRQDRDKLWKYALELKSRTKKVQDEDKMALTKLVTNSDYAIQELQRLCVKAEKILKLAECCKKYEVEKDLIPQYKSSLSEEEQKLVQEHGQIEFPSDLPLQDLEEYHLLDNFWQRYNKVMLQTLALQKEMDDIDDRNMKLRSQLGNYFQSVADSGAPSIAGHDPNERKPQIQEAAILVKYMKH